MCSHSHSNVKMKIARCGHGTYHLSVNDTTLHLSAKDVHTLSCMMAKLTQQLGGQIERDMRSDSSRLRPFDRHSSN